LINVMFRRLVLLLAAAALVLPASPAAAAPLRESVARARPNPGVVITGSGWGHSVGMSQYGAYAMAQDGKSYGQILRHYYRGVAVQDGQMPRHIRVGLGQRLAETPVSAELGEVPWKVCDEHGCSAVKVQPEGRTWTVSVGANGAWKLRRGDKEVFTGGADQRLIADFNPSASANGPIVLALNPNGSRRHYRWGFLEFRVDDAQDRTFLAVLQIPSVELYLRGLGEVPNSWGLKGMAALRAQAVTARTYAIKSHRAFNGLRPGCFCSLLATPLNQAYTGYDKETAEYGELWTAGVESTAGKVATYDGELISTFYSSSHGGRSENSEDSWAYSASFPYLRSVADPWSLDPRAGNPLASWSTTISNADFARFIGSGMRQLRSVRIAGARTAGGSPRTLAAAGVDGDGDAITVNRSGSKGIVGIDLRAAFAYRGHVTLSTLPSQQIRRVSMLPFTDDDGSVHEYSAAFVAAAGIMPGTSATTFSPQRRVTRGQMALAIYRMVRVPDAERDYFDDDDNSRAERAINALAGAGIVRGTGRRQFDPAAAVTRAQMATFFRAALDVRASSNDRFDDDNRSVHEPSINAIAAAGIVSGCTRSRFCPDNTINRGQLATFARQAVERFR
jgi:SpoIID/LytB domain protein